MSYDVKFRKRTIEYMELGHSYRETAKIFGVSLNALTRWVKKYRTTGSLDDTPVKRRRRKIDSERLKAYVNENPDSYQSEMAKHFCCSQQAICRALKRDKITRKKR